MFHNVKNKNGHEGLILRVKISNAYFFGVRETQRNLVALILYVPIHPWIPRMIEVFGESEVKHGFSTALGICTPKGQL